MVNNEVRFLATLAACTPAHGSIVEIGSFKGKSTVALATASAICHSGPVVAIDPHLGLGYYDPNSPHRSPTFDAFLVTLKSAGVDQNVEPHRAFSRDVAKTWKRPIRLLWIDGDHTYNGCKEDFDMFSPFLSEGAVVAFHDSLNNFDGPIRVFVEDVLRSDRFGPSGFVHSIAWSQYRPADGALYREARAQLARGAAKLIPYVAGPQPLTGLRKILYKLTRSRVPRKLISPAAWLKLVSPAAPAHDPSIAPDAASEPRRSPEPHVP